MSNNESQAVRVDLGSLELTEELVRKRAYEFYEERGCEHGHDIEDWLKAEAEILGKHTPDVEEAQEELAGVSA